MAKRLEKLAQEDAQRKQAEIYQRSSGDLANRFVSDHTREEYDNLKRLLKERADLKNNGALPPFVVTGSTIQLSHVALDFFFGQPIVNHRDNSLDLSLGLAPNKSIFGLALTPVRYKLQAAPCDDFSSVVWVGQLGKFESAELVDRMLEMLTRYYL